MFSLWLLLTEGQLESEKWGEAHATTHLFLVRKDDEEDGDQAWIGQVGPLVYLMLLLMEKKAIYCEIYC